jgi:hypothetical protein
MAPRVDTRAVRGATVGSVGDGAVLAGDVRWQQLR